MRTVLLGAAAAAVIGATAGGFSQAQVKSVVAASGGSRLEVASVAAPIAPTVWAIGDTSAAPQPAAIPTADTVSTTGLHTAYWTEPRQPEPLAVEEPAPELVDAYASHLSTLATSHFEPLPDPATTLPTPAPVPAEAWQQPAGATGSTSGLIAASYAP